MLPQLFSMLFSSRERPPPILLFQLISPLFVTVSRPKTIVLIIFFAQEASFQLAASYFCFPEGFQDKWSLGISLTSLLLRKYSTQLRSYLRWIMDYWSLGSLQSTHLFFALLLPGWLESHLSFATGIFRFPQEIPMPEKAPPRLLVYPIEFLWAFSPLV